MKRDLDLVRCILITAEAAKGPVGNTELLNCCEDIHKLAFHIELMTGRGLIVGSVAYDGLNETPLGLEVISITWEGYDYLDSIRSPKVWEKAKEVIAKTVGDTSLSVVKETCTMIATSMIRNSLDL